MSPVDVFFEVFIDMVESALSGPGPPDDDVEAGLGDSAEGLGLGVFDVEVDTPPHPHHSHSADEFLATAYESADTTRPADVTDEQHQRLRRILSEYKECFNTGPHPGGIKSAVKPYVQLKPDAVPSRVVFPLHNPEKAKVLEEQFSEMHRRRLIARVAYSLWLSGTFVVGKKDPTKFRVVHDFRYLNAASVSMGVDLIDYKVLVAQLHGAKYFAVLDLPQAFWQVVVEEGWDAFAFATPDGVFAYRVLPMGCTKNPAGASRAAAAFPLGARLSNPLCRIRHVYRISGQVVDGRQGVAPDPFGRRQTSSSSPRSLRRRVHGPRQHRPHHAQPRAAGSSPSRCPCTSSHRRAGHDRRPR